MRKKDADQKQSEAPRGKKKWIIIAVVAVVLIAAAVGGNTETQQPQTSGTQATSEAPEAQEPTTETVSETEAEAEPEANTSAKVDALALAAKQDVEENGVSDTKRDEAVAFIVEHYPDFYTDNETMEQAISYGYWLEYAYESDESARDYAELGMDLEQAVKYVYRGAESVEDDATQENLSQIRESLEAIGQTIE
ncbi:MAG: hypothetical protein U0N62_03110 [Hydrogeniiclostridium sp.]